MLEAAGALPIYANLLLRLESEAGEEELPEFYAKVLRPSDQSGKRCLIHFTSVPPSVRARLRRLLDQTTAH